jgi:hypothetical protein
MALSDRLQNPPSSRTGTPCSLGAVLATLDPTERAALEQMLGTPEQRGWSAPSIYDALKAEGYEVALQTVNRHRGGRCRCGKDAA